jgi:hypothetical protein
MKKTILAASLMSLPLVNAAPITDSLLTGIKLVEGDDNTKVSKCGAHGRYQMRFPAIMDVARFMSVVDGKEYLALSCWEQYCKGDEHVQRWYCETYLLILSSRFLHAIGREPTEKELLAMWCWQGSGANRISQGYKHWPHQVRDYVTRVLNVKTEQHKS